MRQTHSSASCLGISSQAIYVHLRCQTEVIARVTLTTFLVGSCVSLLSLSHFIPTTSPMVLGPWHLLDVYLKTCLTSSLVFSPFHPSGFQFRTFGNWSSLTITSRSAPHHPISGYCHVTPASSPHGFLPFIPSLLHPLLCSFHDMCAPLHVTAPTVTYERQPLCQVWEACFLLSSLLNSCAEDY